MHEATETVAAQVGGTRCSSQYHPFRQREVRNPDRRYCADLVAWEAYKAALDLRELEERKRCANLVKDYAKDLSFGMRETLLELVRRMEFP